MSLLPVFLKLDGRLCLVVGAGHVALDKIGSLLKTGMRLRVVAPRVLAAVRELAVEGRLELVERGFEADDLAGVALAITATDSAAVNAEVYRLATERGVLCNSVDDIPNCDFFFGSVVSRGELQIAISTAGESPALAQRLRCEIDEQLPDDLGPWLEQIGLLRREVLATMPRSEERRLLLHELAQRQVCASSQCLARQLARDAAPGAGKVYLVGAGPGDPDLLTVKALRLLESAQVVLHDDLVAPAILALAKQAELVNVGKRCGVKHITQEEIHTRMIGAARAGRSVVRLKSGDPLLFGRAAEEMQALAAAGVPCEVVPGVSAAFAAAAAAGVSLTDRTRHHAPDHPAEGDLANATRVIYMPGRDCGHLAEELRASGLPDELPCVLVSKASQPDQRVVHTTLGELAKLEGVAAPSLLIAGWAAAKMTAHPVKIEEWTQSLA
jgi:uroporphyrin-III C-methyltransferase/precorrin-2 dehydrogenase/sirohydrochlorin ferrochelatase